MQEIAFLLGFAQPTSFFRAFRDWTGFTPAAIRAASHRAHDRR
jgi:AraC-like DNA-binding protein